MNRFCIRTSAVLITLGLGSLLGTATTSHQVAAQTQLRQPSPPATAVSESASWRTIEQDVVYGHKVGMALTYDIIQPTKHANGAGVLFMWSGGWVSRFTPPETLVRETLPEQPNLWESLVQSGYTLYIVRHGSSPKFKVPEAVADVRLALQHIRAHAESYHVDADRLGVCGGSAGGHLALMLGTTGDVSTSPADESSSTNRVAAVVAFFPPTDLVPVVGDENERFPALRISKEEAATVSPLQHVTKDDAPTLLVHGDQDELVALSHSQEIASAMKTAGVPHDLIVIEGAAHGFTGKDGLQANKALLAWFDQYLQASTDKPATDHD